MVSLDAWLSAGEIGANKITADTNTERRMRPRPAHLRKAPKRERTPLVMIVFVMTVFMGNMPTMIVPVMMGMSVLVFMRVFMPLGMVM
jgi:hypothetical protein